MDYLPFGRTGDAPTVSPYLTRVGVKRIATEGSHQGEGEGGDEGKGVVEGQNENDGDCEHEKEGVTSSRSSCGGRGSDSGGSGRRSGGAGDVPVRASKTTSKAVIDDTPRKMRRTQALRNARFNQTGEPHSYLCTTYLNFNWCLPFRLHLHLSTLTFESWRDRKRLPSS